MRMLGFPPRFFPYHSSSTSTRSTGSDRRSRDPFRIPLGVSMRNRKLSNIHPSGAFYPTHKELCPYYSVIPPHTGVCPIRQCYPHMNSYVSYCSAKPPHKELFPLL